MKISIEKVYAGSEYMGTIYDFHILGTTKTGKKIIICDYKYDLREYEGKIVDCLIDAFMAQDINKINLNEKYDPRHPIIKGIFIGKYNIPLKWKTCKNKNSYLFRIDYEAVETIDGIMTISDYEGELKIGESIIFTVGRLELKAWIPIDE